MTRRCAGDLPRYVLRKLVRGIGYAYYFNVPMWARQRGCPVKNEALGTDKDAAAKRAEQVLLPHFDSWRTSGVSDGAAPVPVLGTLNWAFAEFRADSRFTKLDARTKRNHESGMRLVGGYVMTDGRKLGDQRLANVTTAVTDRLYEKLLIMAERLADGTVIERERRTTVNHAMKTCRRAWNIAARRNPGKVPMVNPFSKMGLHSPERETPTATFAELQLLPHQGNRVGAPFPGHRRPDRVGVAASREGHLLHLRGCALSTKGPAARRLHRTQED
jgi:hypothetical protein